MEVYRIRVNEGDVLSRKLMGNLAEVEGRALQEKVQPYTFLGTFDATTPRLTIAHQPYKHIVSLLNLQLKTGLSFSALLRTKPTYKKNVSKGPCVFLT